MWIAFARPVFLLLLPVAGLLLWHSARDSFADLTGTRLRVAWAARVLLMLSLIMALAGMQVVRRSDELVVVFAVDESFSVPREERTRALEFIREALAMRRPQDRGALVYFGREASVESESLRRPGDVRDVARTAPTHTDIASGLRLALGLIPPGSAGKVVLLSDGNENVGAVAGELLLSRANKVSVDVVPLRTRKAQDVLVREIHTPSEARRGEPFPVRVAIEATQPTEATVTLIIDDEPTQTQSVALSAGASSLRVPVQIADPGFHKVQVLIEGAGDQCRENDLGMSFVRVKGKPRVLIVDQDPSELDAIRRGLSAQDVEVEVGGPEALPINIAELERYDSVFLSNYPAYRMTQHQMTMFRDSVRDLGIGLGMIGGEYSFGAGGYYRTPIEEALPVTMDINKQRVFPAAAVLLVMDTSGSMGMIEDGVEKIQLAAEAACAVVDLLQPYDAVGFIASDPKPTEVLPLTKLQSKESAKTTLRSVGAGGGGIACYPSLSAAYNVLKASNAPIRHIIMLADGSDCDEQGGCVELASQVASEKITLTAIAFGDGPHVPFLKQVAAAGDGQYYLTQYARDLKKIFTRETLTVAKSALMEEPFKAQPQDASPVTSGIDWGSAPPLLGYVATSPKDLARMPLVSHKQDPVLAHWQYGLGRSVAFTSDAKNHWAAHWMQWPEFGKFWGQAVRYSLRQLSSGVLYPRVEAAGDAAMVVVDAVAQDGELLSGLDIQANVNLPDGSRRQVRLEQTAAGRYSAQVQTPVSGPYVVGLTAEGPEGFSATQTVGFAMAYPPDYADTEPNDALLAGIAEQTGGSVLTGPEDVFSPPAEVPTVPIDIWRLLLWIAAVLLPIDVGVRRLLITRDDVARAFAAAMSVVAAARARLRPRRIEAPSTAGHLLDHIKASRSERPVDVPRIDLGTTRSGADGARPADADIPRVEEPVASASSRGDGKPVADGDTFGRLLKKKRERREGDE